MHLAFPTLPPGDPLTVSATTYVAYTQCPESAAARLRGEYGPESKASFRGGLSHRIFARHLRSGPIPDAEFSQACREEIGQGMNPKLVALGLKPGELRSLISETAALYERFKLMSFSGAVEAEVPLEVDAGADVTLRGSIDAVFAEGEGFRLVDWKTGDLDTSTEDQLAFYALLWVLEKQELPARVEALSVRTGQRLESVPSEDAARATAVVVADLVNEVRRSWGTGAVMDRSGGPWCRYCPLLDECREGRAAVRIVSG